MEREADRGVPAWIVYPIALAILLIVVHAFVHDLVLPYVNPGTPGQAPTTVTPQRELRVRVVALNTFYNYVVGFTGDVVFDGYATAVLVAPGEVCAVGNATLCVLQGEVPAPACFRNSLNTTVVLFALAESGEHPGLYEAYALRALKPGAEDCILVPRRLVLSLAKP